MKQFKQLRRQLNDKLQGGHDSHHGDSGHIGPAALSDPFSVSRSDTGFDHSGLNSVGSQNDLLLQLCLVSTTDSNWSYTRELQALQDFDRKLDCLKHACSETVKKLTPLVSTSGTSSTVTVTGQSNAPSGSGPNADRVEKKIRKVPEFALGNTWVEQGKTLETLSGGFCNSFGDILHSSGLIEIQLGTEEIQFHMRIGEGILSKFVRLMDVDIPHLSKTKSAYKKSIGELEDKRQKVQNIRNKLSNLMSTATSSPEDVNAMKNKLDTASQELDDMKGKVDLSKDTLCSDILSLISREAELSSMAVSLLKMQESYYYKIWKILQELVPPVETSLVRCRRPVFGTDLATHLINSGRSIAWPLEACITAMLIHKGEQEEGIFRVAGGASKVRRLKSLFDSGSIDSIPTFLSCLDLGFMDCHVTSSLLKSYLRELPEALLTSALYQEWISAVLNNQNQSEEQTKVVVLSLLNRLPEVNRRNLAYLTRYLRDVSMLSDVNRMTPSNLAIVIGPNLLWSGGRGSTIANPGPSPNISSSEDLMPDMRASHVGSHVVEMFIADWSYFFGHEFKGDFDYFISCDRASVKEFEERLCINGSSSPAPEASVTSGSSEESSSSGLVNTESFQKTSGIYRPKMAPLPPALVGQSRIPGSGAGAVPVALLPKGVDAEPMSPVTNSPKANEKQLPSSNSQTLPNNKRKAHRPPLPPAPAIPPTYAKTEESETTTTPTQSGPGLSSSLNSSLDLGDNPPVTPLRHKNSFQKRIVQKEDSKEIETSGEMGSEDAAICVENSDQQNFFRSLPRGFSTKRSFKGERPNFEPPAPAPENVEENEQGTVVLRRKQSRENAMALAAQAAKTGFVQGLKSVDPEKEKPSKADRPVPLPRNSLLVGSHGGSPGSITGSSAPVCKDRQSLIKPVVMAKPDRSSLLGGHIQRAKTVDNQPPETAPLSESEEKYVVLPTNSPPPRPPLPMSHNRMGSGGYAYLAGHPSERKGSGGGGRSQSQRSSLGDMNSTDL